jgi:hypothetical protein
VPLVHGHFGDLRLARPRWYLLPFPWRWIVNTAGLWWLAWGKWWSIVFYSGRAINLGVHVEPWRRERGVANGGPQFYGPYLDLHLPFVCVSFGHWPIYAGNLEAQRNYARGGQE